MAQALVSAKTQTVKEIKHNSLIKKRRKLIIKFALIFIVIILLALILNRIVVENRYSFTDRESKIKFISDGFHIKEGFDIFSQDDNFLVIFNYNYSDTNYLSSIVNGIVYTQSMLSAKNKDVILLISVVDQENNLLYCQSNHGSVYENNELTKEECLTLINSDYSTIMVNYISVDKKYSEVVLNLQEKLLLVNPNKKEDVYTSLVISFNKMFKDARLIEEALGNIQDKINNIENTSSLDSNNVDDNLSNDQNIFIDTNVVIDDISVDINSIDINSIDTNSVDTNVLYDMNN